MCAVQGSSSSAKLILLDARDLMEKHRALLRLRIVRMGVVYVL